MSPAAEQMHTAMDDACDRLGIERRVFDDWHQRLADRLHWYRNLAQAGVCVTCAGSGLNHIDLDLDGICVACNGSGIAREE